MAFGFWDAFCTPPNLMVEKCEWLFVYILFCCFFRLSLSLYVIYVDFFASPLDLKEDLVVFPGSPQSCPMTPHEIPLYHMLFLVYIPFRWCLFPIPIRPVALALLHAWPWTWESGDPATTVIRNGNPMNKTL